MKKNPFQHIDLRVNDLEQAWEFYSRILPAIGFEQGNKGKRYSGFDAHGNPPEQAWFGFTEDKNHQANANRIAFWVASREEVDAIGELIKSAGARNIRVSNTLADKQILATLVTRNRHCQYGADGLAFDSRGNLYVGNFGDGAIHKISFDQKGTARSNTIFAKTDHDYELDPAKPGFLAKAAKDIDTVFTVDLATRIAPDGSVPTAPYVEEADL